MTSNRCRMSHLEVLLLNHTNRFWGGCNHTCLTENHKLFSDTFGKPHEVREQEKK